VGLLLAISVGIRPTAFPFALSVHALVALSALRDWQRLARLVAGLVLPWAVLLMAWIAGAALERAPSPLAVGGRAAAWASSAVSMGLVWTEGGRGTLGIDVGVDPLPVLETMSDQQRSTYMRTAQDQPFQFIAAHPDFFVQQAVRKARTLWAPVLPEASRAHAFLSLAWFTPLYCLSAVGLAIAFRHYRELAMVTSVAIATFTLTSMLTFVDYDQRYRLPIELFLIPLAATGLVWLMEKRTAPARILERVEVAGR
jgi:hypothetical protein